MKILLDLASGGQELESTYGELYTLLNSISQGNPDWNNDVSWGVVKKPIGMIEIYTVIALAALLSTLEN